MVTDGDVLEIGARIADPSRLRHAAFNEGFWADIVAGPASRLARALHSAGTPSLDVTALVTTYLELSAEGMGSGLLFPTTGGSDSPFTMAFLEVIPEALAAIPAPRRAETLAACFNLGENLAGAPLWLRRIFVRLSRSGFQLESLPDLVARVERGALQPPTEPLGRRVAHRLVSLAREDPRFLPGPLHFLAPTVLCVHDRHRVAAAGRPPETCGVWLVEAPVVLGPLRCVESVSADRTAARPLLSRVARSDPRISPTFSSAANEWRAAASMTTSQMIVALLPEPAP